MYTLLGLRQEVFAKKKVVQTLRRKLMSCNKCQVIYKKA